MRYRRNNTDPSGGFAWLAVTLAFTLFGLLVAQVVRVLRQPDTRTYEPTSPSNPTVRRGFSALLNQYSASQLLALVLLIAVMGGSLLLYADLNLGLSLRLDHRLLSLFLVLGTLCITAITFAADHAAASVSALATVCFGGLALSIVLLRTSSLLVQTTLVAGAIATGVAFLWVLAPVSSRKVTVESWVTLGVWCAILTLIGWLISPQPAVFIVGACFAGAFLGAALLSMAMDSDRFLVLLVTCIGLISAGAAQAFAVPAITVTLLLGATIVLGLAAILLVHGAQGSQRWLLPDSFTPQTRAPAVKTITTYPARTDYEAAVATNLMRQLLNARLPLTLRTRAVGGRGTVWQIDVPAVDPVVEAVLDDVSTHFPDATCATSEKETDEQFPRFRKLIVFGLANDYAAPLPELVDFKTHDPLSILTQRMSHVDATQAERIAYEVVVTTHTHEARQRAIKRLLEGKIFPLSGYKSNVNDPTSGLDGEQVNRKLDASTRLYHAFVTLTVESTDRERIESLAAAAADVEQYHNPVHNRLVRVRETPILTVSNQVQAAQFTVQHLIAAWEQQSFADWGSALLVLSPDELAALWHFPTDAFEAPGIAWSSGRVPEALTDPTDGVRLGDIVQPGVGRQPIFLKNHDRAHHQYIAGTTGAGKSTLMHSLIQADILAGHGVAVIDPHGTLIDDILECSIPASRLHDVVLLECGQGDPPVPLNPLRIPEGVSLEQAYTYVIYAMKKMYDDIWLEGRTGEYIENIVQLLLTDREATPRDVRRILTDDAYRQQLLNRLADIHDLEERPTADAEDFWNDYQRKKDKERDLIIAPIVTRTRALLRKWSMTLMTCNPMTIDYRSMIRDQKIVLISLRGDYTESEVNSLATLFLTGFYLSALSLGAIDKNAAPRCYLYIDEVERVADAPLLRLLTETRKFGLATILTSQILDQIPSDVLPGILGIVGTKTVFEIGPKDADVFAPFFEPEMPHNDLTRLGLHRAAVITRANGRNAPPFVVDTLKPERMPQAVDAEQVCAVATQNFLSRQAVIDWLDHRYPRATGRGASTMTSATQQSTDEASANAPAFDDYEPVE